MYLMQIDSLREHLSHFKLNGLLYFQIDAQINGCSSNLNDLTSFQFWRFSIKRFSLLFSAIERFKFFFQLQSTVHIILYWFQVCSVVVGQSCPSQSGSPTASGPHPAPHIVIVTLLTVFSVLDLPSRDCSVTARLCSQPLPFSPSPTLLSVTAVSKLLFLFCSVCKEQSS